MSHPQFDIVGKVVVDFSAPAALRKGWRWWQVGPGPTCHHLQKHRGESRSDEESTTTFPKEGEMRPCGAGMGMTDSQAIMLEIPCILFCIA